MELSSLDDDIELLNILPKKSIKILKMSLSSSLTASKITIFTVYVPHFIDSFKMATEIAVFFALK